MGTHQKAMEEQGIVLASLSIRTEQSYRRREQTYGYKGGKVGSGGGGVMNCENGIDIYTLISIK